MTDTLHIFVFYDIQRNDKRTKIAQTLTAAGLVRIQYSVFAGYIRRKYYNKMTTELDDIMLKYPHIDDKIYFLPIGQQQHKKINMLGKTTDWATIFEPPTTIFL